jgi:CheY-like chemotaxis protein
MATLQTNSTGLSISQQPEGALAQFADARVLFVDDELISCVRMQRALQDAGIRVVRTAYDGMRGLALHEAEPFDIILLNEIMPRMRGTNVLKALRRRGDRVPVVVHSACTLADIERRCHGPLPASKFVQSPFTEADYIETVRDVLMGAARASLPGASGIAKKPNNDTAQGSSEGLRQ